VEILKFIFTGPGTFTVTCAGNPLGSNSVDYLVVAGGGQLEHMMLIQDQLYQVEQVVVDQHLDQMVLLH
jgi:hypothetical protein